MKNYQNSDYALNKFSEGIVYKFTDQIVEVTLADYLTENPGKTEQEFRELKAMSDAMFYEQDRADYRRTWKDVSIHGMEETHDLGGLPLDEQYIETLDRRYAAEAIAWLLESGKLTEKQRRRFVLHIVDGFSLREIADEEEVHYTSVNESIAAAISKLRKKYPLF